MKMTIKSDNNHTNLEDHKYEIICELLFCVLSIEIYVVREIILLY